MDRRRIFTVDPDYFPMDRMREIVDYLHSNDQKYSAYKLESHTDIDLLHCHTVVMTDPAVAYTPDEDYAPYHRGTDMDVWIKAPNGSASLGLVWPGVTVYPDWFHPNISKWATSFASVIALSLMNYLQLLEQRVRVVL